MERPFEQKLDQIENFWKHFILDYKYFLKDFKTNDEQRIKFLGALLGYFKDVIPVAFQEEVSNDLSEKFSFAISFLQAIYVHQDFVEEMLDLFNTGIDKGQLKTDPFYFENRNIRNELVGHPIRKFEEQIVSSTLFSYQAEKGEIEYLRYHRENNFKFESISFSIVEVQNRHEIFLEKYLDKIILRLKTVVGRYLKELETLETVIKNNDFDTVLKLTALYFEAIFKSDFVYDRQSLLIIYKRKNEHPRYQNFIDMFYQDLLSSVLEKRQYAIDIFEEKISHDQEAEEFPSYKIEVVSLPYKDFKETELKVTYHYEIGKLATKRTRFDFEHFGSALKQKCLEMPVVLDELEHMEKNLNDDIEYYTSLRLICTELGED